MIDLGRAERIAKSSDPRFYKPPPPIAQVYSKRRIAALSVYMQAKALPCEFARKPYAHADYPWIVCVPHAITPEGVVYADVQDTREVHRQRVSQIPDDKFLRCQAFMAVTGAPVCDYITTYRMSEDEARAERGAAWGAHDRAWKWRKTFYHIHRLKRDEEVIAHLLKQAFDIREKAGHGKEEEGRPGTDGVRAKLVSRRRPPSSARKTHGTRHSQQGQRDLPGGSRGRLGHARQARTGEGED